MNQGVRRCLLVGGFGLLSAWSLMTACSPATQEVGELPDDSPGVSKTAVHAADKPDLSSVFNWGLKVANFTELFLVSGFAATDAEGTVLFPGDAAAQTEYVLGRVEAFVEENGYSKDDIVRFEITVTQDVPPEDFQALVSGYKSHRVNWLKLGLWDSCKPCFISS